MLDINEVRTGGELGGHTQYMVTDSDRVLDSSSTWAEVSPPNINHPSPAESSPQSSPEDVNLTCAPLVNDGPNSEPGMDEDGLEGDVTGWDDADDVHENENLGMDKLEAMLEEYKVKVDEKPPLSYIALISLAIQSSASQKTLLADIYQWISDHFPYFKMKDRSWRNSVRHNLSLNECFTKVGRADNGKGNYWGIHRACADDFTRGDFRRRRARRRVRHCNGLLKTNVGGAKESEDLPLAHVDALYKVNHPEICNKTSETLDPDAYIPMTVTRASTHTLVGLFGVDVILGREERALYLNNDLPEPRQSADPLPYFPQMDPNNNLSSAYCQSEQEDYHNTWPDQCWTWNVGNADSNTMSSSMTSPMTTLTSPIVGCPSPDFPPCSATAASYGAMSHYKPQCDYNNPLTTFYNFAQTSLPSACGNFIGADLNCDVISRPQETDVAFSNNVPPYMCNVAMI